MQPCFVYKSIGINSVRLRTELAADCNEGLNSFFTRCSAGFKICCRGGSRGRVQGVRPPPPPLEMTCRFLIQLVFCQKKKTMWFIGVEVEQETSAPPPRKKYWIRPCVVWTLSWSTMTKCFLELSKISHPRFLCQKYTNAKRFRSKHQT